MDREERIYRLFFARGGKAGKRKKKDGIHIDPKNEGKFTESARRAGMGVQEYAAHVLAHKEDYDGLTVRRANFARNFGGASHRRAERQEGGVLGPDGVFDESDQGYSGIPDIDFFPSDTLNPIYNNPMAPPSGLAEWMGQGGLTGIEAYKEYGNNTGKFNEEFAKLFNFDDVRKIDFRNYKTKSGRRFNAANMNAIQDSLIRYGVPAAQRAAILGTILHESGGDPSAVDATGNFYGLLQWSRQRMGPDESVYGSLDAQVRKILDELSNPMEGDWTDGAEEGERVSHAHEGRWNFMSADDPERASLFLNKCYVRPYALKNQRKSRLAAYDSRGAEARAIFDLLGELRDADEEPEPLDSDRYDKAPAWTIPWQDSFGFRSADS